MIYEHEGSRPRDTTYRMDKLSKVIRLTVSIIFLPVMIVLLFLQKKTKDLYTRYLRFRERIAD